MGNLIVVLAVVLAAALAAALAAVPGAAQAQRPGAAQGVGQAQGQRIDHATIGQTPGLVAVGQAPSAPIVVPAQPLVPVRVGVEAPGLSHATAARAETSAASRRTKAFEEGETPIVIAEHYHPRNEATSPRETEPSAPWRTSACAKAPHKGQEMAAPLCKRSCASCYRRI